MAVAVETGSLLMLTLAATIMIATLGSAGLASNLNPAAATRRQFKVNNFIFPAAAPIFIFPAAESAAAPRT